jgi:hypothetical protein
MMSTVFRTVLELFLAAFFISGNPQYGKMPSDRICGRIAAHLQCLRSFSCAGE